MVDVRAADPLGVAITAITRAERLEARMHAAEERIRQLEQHIHYPNDVIKNRMLDMQETATRQQALYAPLRPDTAPMRSDVGTILKYQEFIKRLAYNSGDMYWHVDPIVSKIAADLLEGK